jgi:hypothetical protein
MKFTGYFFSALSAQKQNTQANQGHAVFANPLPMRLTIYLYTSNSVNVLPKAAKP